MGRHADTAIFANEQFGSPRSGKVVQFIYTGFWLVVHMGQHTGTQILADELLDFKSKHRATIDLYWILEGTGYWDRYTSTVVFANKLWGLSKSGTVAQFIYTGFWRMSRNQDRGSEWGTWAGTQALQFW